MKPVFATGYRTLYLYLEGSPWAQVSEAPCCSFCSSIFIIYQLSLLLYNFSEVWKDWSYPLFNTTAHHNFKLGRVILLRDLGTTITFHVPPQTWKIGLKNSTDPCSSTCCGILLSKFQRVWHRRCYLDQLLTHDCLKMWAGKLKMSEKERFCSILLTFLWCYGTEDNTE